MPSKNLMILHDGANGADWVAKTIMICWIASSAIGCDSNGDGEPASERQPPVVAWQISASQEGSAAELLTSGLTETRLKEIPEFVRIPAGVNAGAAPYADMGLEEYENKMSHDIYMDTTEVTFLKWRTVKEWARAHEYEFVNGDKAPDILGGGDSDKLFEVYEHDLRKDKYPVTGMTWYDCLKWCNARSEMDGLEPVYYVDGKPYRKGVHEPTADVSKSGWRLPTEDEWRYAARGGKVGFRFPWGNAISHMNANYSGGKTFYDYDSSEGEHPEFKGFTAPVASFPPNGYGLYDMVGNAWEYTQDSYGDNGEWVKVCGGDSSSHPHFLQIEHLDGRLKEGGCGFRTLRLAVEKKPEAESTVVVNQELVAKMSAVIKNALRQPKSKMEHCARNMATFPSWNKSQKGKAYTVGDHICIWHKAPLLDIDADSRRWMHGLGPEKYKERAKELRSTQFSYLHSLAIYDPSWWDDSNSWLGESVPIPCIVITVERSTASKAPYVCAFTPDGHRNFGNSDDLSSDAGMLLNAFAAIAVAMDDKTPNGIGDAADGISALKRMRNKPRGDTKACGNCKGTGLVNGALCPRCKGWGKL